jgi:hypothetical protein
LVDQRSRRGKHGGCLLDPVARGGDTAGTATMSIRAAGPPVTLAALIATGRPGLISLHTTRSRASLGPLTIEPPR